MIPPDKWDRHPAYGVVTVGRVTGTTYLFGSEASHNQYISVKVHTAEVARDLSEDRIHSDATVVEIYMSHAQWAEFVSSAGLGGGTPCTLNYIRGQGRIPSLEPPKGKVDKFTDDVKRNTADLRKHIRSLRDKVRAMRAASSIRKGDMDAVSQELDTLAMRLETNLPFIASQFQENVDKTLAHAKIELDAYVQARVQTLGIQASELPQFMLSRGDGPPPSADPDDMRYPPDLPLSLQHEIEAGNMTATDAARLADDEDAQREVPE